MTACQNDHLYQAIERQAAFDSVGGICVHCKVRAASVLHHNPPKGVRRKWAGDLVPLCHICHSWAHESTRRSVQVLRQDLRRAKDVGR